MDIGSFRYLFENVAKVVSLNLSRALTDVPAPNDESSEMSPDIEFDANGVPSFEGVDMAAFEGLPMFGDQGNPSPHADMDAADPVACAYAAADMLRLDALLAAVPPPLPDITQPLSPEEVEEWLKRLDDPNVHSLVLEVRKLAL